MISRDNGGGFRDKTCRAVHGCLDRSGIPREARLDHVVSGFCGSDPCGRDTRRVGHVGAGRRDCHARLGVRQGEHDLLTLDGNAAGRRRTPNRGRSRVDCNAVSDLVVLGHEKLRVVEPGCYWFRDKQREHLARVLDTLARNSCLHPVLAGLRRRDIHSSLPVATRGAHIRRQRSLRSSAPVLVKEHEIHTHAIHRGIHGGQHRRRCRVGFHAVRDLLTRSHNEIRAIVVDLRTSSDERSNVVLAAGDAFSPDRSDNGVVTLSGRRDRRKHLARAVRQPAARRDSRVERSGAVGVSHDELHRLARHCGARRIAHGYDDVMFVRAVSPSVARRHLECGFLCIEDAGNRREVRVFVPSARDLSLGDSRGDAVLSGNLRGDSHLRETVAVSCPRGRRQARRSCRGRRPVWVEQRVRHSASAHRGTRRRLHHDRADMLGRAIREFVAFSHREARQRRRWHLWRHEHDRLR